MSSNFANHIVDVVDGVLPHLPAVLFDLLLGILIIRILVRLFRLSLKITHIQPGLRDVLTGIIETIMWIFLSIALLNELGFSGVIYFFTGSVAALGLAMAAGGSTLVADIIAGIFLARDTDFNVGDQLIVGDPPTRGVVESMDARRTRLRDDHGVLHVVPNSVIERKEWVVIDRHPTHGPLKRATAAAKRAAAAVTRDKPPTRNVRLRKNDQ